MPKGIPKNGINKGWFKKTNFDIVKGSGFCEDCGKKIGDYAKRCFSCTRVYVGINQRAENHWHWKNGESKTAGGYIVLNTYRGKVYKHRVILENKLGRDLDTNEHIHHIDGDRSNNSIENLELMTKENHLRLEAEKRVRDNGGRFI